jgi:hypothetical protein
VKIWHGYGSEHSMNLVMIGHFKSSEDAEKTQELIKELSEGLSDKIEIGAIHDRFDHDVLDLLIKTDCSSLSRFELEHFLYEDTHTQVEGDKIILTTDEFEVSAFFKLMILKGAKVEVYSAHDYPDAECVRGK